MSGRRLDLALSQRGHRFVDVSLPGLRGLSVRNWQHQHLLLAVGQAIEQSLCLGIAVEGSLKVFGQGHLARLGVQLEVDVQHLAGLDAGDLALLVAHPDHELAADHRHCAAIGVTAVDGHPDRGPLVGTKPFDDLWRDLDPRGGLARGQKLGTKSHRSRV